jgi:hypothetical protein
MLKKYVYVKKIEQNRIPFQMCISLAFLVLHDERQGLPPISIVPTHCAGCEVKNHGENWLWVASVRGFKDLDNAGRFLREVQAELPPYSQRERIGKLNFP